MMIMRNPVFSGAEPVPGGPGANIAGSSNQNAAFENTDIDFSGIFEAITACFSPFGVSASRIPLIHGDGAGAEAGAGQSTSGLNISAVQQGNEKAGELLMNPACGGRQTDLVPEFGSGRNQGHDRIIDTAAIFSSVRTESAKEASPELKDIDFFRNVPQPVNSDIQTSNLTEGAHIERKLPAFTQIHIETAHENKLPEKIVYALKDGVPEMELELDPPSLGRLKMQIVTDDNRVSIKIVTDTPHAKEILDGGIRKLETALIDSGFEIDTLDISLSQRRNEQQFDRPAADYGIDRPEADASNGPSDTLISLRTYLDPNFRFGRIDFFA